MDRRDFLESLTGCMIATVGGFPLARHLTGSTGWATATRTELLEAGQESAGAVAGPVKYPARGATLQGYLARPQSRGPHPAVLLLPANSGLDEHIRNVARRYSQEGFVAIAVDQLSRHGGTASFGSRDAVRQNIEAVSSEEAIANLDAAFEYLQSHPSVRRDCIGVTGFAGGGRLAFQYAASNSKLKAAVVFDSEAPLENIVAAIRCPVLAHYGRNAPQHSLWTSSKVRKTVGFMDKHGKSFHPKIYPAAGAGFFDATSPAYEEVAAQQAWETTLAFFHQHLERDEVFSATRSGARHFPSRS